MIAVSPSDRSSDDISRAPPRRSSQGRDQATIIDVAHTAGVSIKTVSRVLNREKNVSPQTRAHVLAAAAALNYTPNVSARSLAGARSYLIALLYDNPSAAYIADLQAGAFSACRAGGYHLVVEPFDSNGPAVAQAVSDLVVKLRTDGLILTPPLSDHLSVLDALDHLGAPYVRIAPGAWPKRGATVAIDDRMATLELTRLLIRDGHRRIGFVEGRMDHGASRVRREGFLAAYREFGLTPDPDLIAPGQFSFLSGVEAGSRLLERDDRPSAVFACNDDMALGVMSVANRLGLSMPAQLSVAGFDDTPTARVVWPQLTTVRQPVSEMAAAAVRMLIDGATGEKAKGLQLDFEIILRGSTGHGPYLGVGF
jgi:LacI family transcriptional regulator